MTAFMDMEMQFIQRTKIILTQYDKYRPKEIGEEKYKVTLLMNFFMGLLIYPQQRASINQGRWGEWLTKDYVANVAEQWALKPSDFKCAGYKKVDKAKNPDGEVQISFQQLTMRNLIRQMRNTAAHAAIDAEDHAQRGTIGTVTFQNRPTHNNGRLRPNGFHLVLPVKRLRQFVDLLADSAINQIARYPYP